MLRLERVHQRTTSNTCFKIIEVGRLVSRLFICHYVLHWAYPQAQLSMECTGLIPCTAGDIRHFARFKKQANAAVVGRNPQPFQCIKLLNAFPWEMRMCSQVSKRGKGAKGKARGPIRFYCSSWCTASFLIPL